MKKTVAICFVLISIGLYFLAERSDHGNIHSEKPAGIPVAKSPKKEVNSANEFVETRQLETARGGEAEIDKSDGTKTSKSRFSIPPSGIIPSTTAEKLGFDSEQLKKAQAEVNLYRKRVEEAMTSRAYYDESSSDPNIGKDVYRIPAMSDGGDSLRKEFKEKLSAVVGQSNADLLWSDDYTEPYGGYGKYDVVLEFEPNEEFVKAGIDLNAIQVNYTYTNPNTGTDVIRGTRTLESFSTMFGQWSQPKK